MDINSKKCCLIKIRIRLKKLYFHGQITKSFHSQTCFNIYISAEIYLSEKLNLYLYLVKNFQINSKNKLRVKYLLNILPLYKASSCIWWLILCEK